MAAGAATNGVVHVRAGSTGVATCVGADRCVTKISRAATIGMAVTAVSLTATGTAARDLEAASASAARTSVFGKMAAKMAAVSVDATLAARTSPRHKMAAVRVADASADATSVVRTLPHRSRVVARVADAWVHATSADRISPRRYRAVARAQRAGPRLVDASAVRAPLARKRVGVVVEAIMRVAETVAGKAVTGRTGEFAPFLT